MRWKFTEINGNPVVILYTCSNCWTTNFKYSIDPRTTNRKNLMFTAIYFLLILNSNDIKLFPYVKNIPGYKGLCLCANCSEILFLWWRALSAR